MLKFNSKNLLLCLLGLTLAGSGQASIIYSALPNQSGASDLNCCREADDFTVAGAVTVRQIELWAFQGTAASYAGSIEWSINNNSSGLPGTSIASGLATPAPVSTGKTGFGLNEFAYIFNVNVALSAGTYWLVLHDGPSSTIPGTDFFWEWSNATAGNSQSQDLSAPGQPWISNFSELAFQLQDATPEPSSILLFGGGLLALWTLRSRKRA